MYKISIFLCSAILLSGCVVMRKDKFQTVKQTERSLGKIDGLNYCGGIVAGMASTEPDERQQAVEEGVLEEIQKATAVQSNANQK